MEINDEPRERIGAHKGGVALRNEKEDAVRLSLRRFDNHDGRLPYYHLMLEQELTDIPEFPLPEGFHYVNYAPGDRDAWIAVERSAREFDSEAAGVDAWNRYFEGHDSELKHRMFFVADAEGRKVATATAYYDIRTGDDGRTGWLHWVAIRRDAQGQHLSKPLITRVLRYMKELGYRRAVIPTQTTTWLACKIYLDLGFRPIPENAEHSLMGWRIVKTLTGHPALAGFDAVEDNELSGETEKVREP